ncbi:Hypoxanthine phosphoribosyltransferase [Buchnera aphidicola (Chaitophorus populicola)]|uniref:hypoxanthine phosphoribosyltransferase n=1 Tax=Buchnera aphidicola TaxID=9 RepID=UPI003463CAF3
MKHSIEVILPAYKLNSRVKELGMQITENYKNSCNEIILIGLLKGSFIFIADLCRAVQINHKIDFITISSYGNNHFSNLDIKILKDLDENIYGKNVLIIEDIIDSGRTLNKVLKLLKLKKPKSLSICTLLDKPECREVDIIIDYVGFSIPNDFVVGYGLDYAQSYRHLPYIARVIF